MVDELPPPCQPIGCDNGIHVDGCVYAAWEDDIVEEETGITLENSSGTHNVDPGKVF